ncbi:hypothetical protein KUCAC02_007047 [Chaenocephalus aceratus]|nr:hypothetical protein KUCAC02_007047 [Chaenocephalus aceratus]
MLKLLLNVFSTVGVLGREDGQQIMWKHIEELHKLQEKEASWQQAKNGAHPVEKSENEARRQTDKIKEGKVVRRKLTKLIHFYGD